MMNRCLNIFFAIVLLCSCKNEETKMDTNDDGLVFNRLDVALATYASLEDEQRSIVVDSLGDVFKAWFYVQGKTEFNDSVLIEYSESDAMRVFYEDICSKFSNITPIDKVILKLKENILNEFSNNYFYELYTIVSPYNQSIFIADSMMFVGLNHYLGSDYPGYGYFEPYQRIVKTPQHLPYDIAESYLLCEYPYISSSDETVLNTLLYNGVIIYAMMQLVPNADLTEALGYSKEQLLWAERNEKDAWNAIISRNLLYSTNKHDANRLVNPSPATSILHQESPGRLGRYIGYKIVKSYIKNHSNKNLEWLLSPDFYNSIQSLIDSKYGL